MEGCCRGDFGKEATQQGVLDELSDWSDFALHSMCATSTNRELQDLQLEASMVSSASASASTSACGCLHCCPYVAFLITMSQSRLDPDADLALCLIRGIFKSYCSLVERSPVWRQLRTDSSSHQCIDGIAFCPDTSTPAVVISTSAVVISTSFIVSPLLI